MKELTTENYKFHSHKACEFFPCHPTEDQDSFNCLFCYCPLYPMGKDCGGNFVYLEGGIKDCSNCMVPHKKGNYDYMMSRLMEFHQQLREAGRL